MFVPQGADGVLQKKEHSLDSSQLSVRLHHPVLEGKEKEKRKGGRKSARKEIQMEHDLVTHIQKHYKEELDDLLQQLEATITPNETTNTIVISPLDRRGSWDQPWSETVEGIRAFLAGFTKTFLDLDFNEGHAAEVQKQWHEVHPISDTQLVEVTFVESESCVQFIGRTAYLAELIEEFQKLVRKIEDDDQLKRSVTRDVEKDIPQEKLHLLKISGFCDKLERERKHLSISVDVENSSLTFEGPRVELQEANTELWKFLTKAKEQVIELSERLLRVLLSPNGSRFLQESFREQEIVAILLPGQRKTSNEAIIMGLTAEHTKKAGRFIQSAVKECSLSLTEENAQVTKDQKWKEFVSLMMSRNVVEVEIVSNTLWVSGISQDVARCFPEVKDFMNENTILRNLISTPEGCTRFLFKEWKAKLKEIKRKYSIEFRATRGNEGIEIYGTAENLTKCAEEVQNLILKVNSDTLDINKPGMGKFFSQGQGTRLLRVVEGDHHCIIVAKRSADVDEVPFAEEGRAIEDERNNVMCICSYVTPEGKTISVYKDDLTKHRVDAIVNAANERLEHIGGLAGAIVKAGGKEIQKECRAFVRERGNLLEGRTYVSKSGTLPCKHIIHVVGPQWDYKAKREREKGKKTRQEGMLEYSISNCLEDAKSLSSIAIPAVSSGVFGFPLDLCVEVIVETAIQFCKKNPTCKLSEIHLTNSDDAMVAQFANEMRKRFGQEQTFYDRDKVKVGLNRRRDTSSVLTRIGNSLRAQNYLRTTESYNISLRLGDITKKQVS